MWRLANAADDSAVINLWQALNREDVAESPPPRAYIERTLPVLRQSPERGCIAVLQSQADIVGYALLVHLWGNEQGGDVCVIDELYVVPAQRGKGHATALLRGIVEGCTVWPEPPVAMQLEVSPTNPAAQRLYERFGFKVLRNTCMRRMARQS